MAKWNDTNRKTAPLPPPNNILHECDYRGRRIVLTDDVRLVGATHPDAWGFTVKQGFVVLDEFDENVFPIGMHWFFTPEDAATAIELLDNILPVLKERTPATTLLYEYGLLRSYRKEFWHVYGAIAEIQKLCDDAAAFEENPGPDIHKRLQYLHTQARHGRSIG